MIQLKILSGKQAGTVTAARRFPFRIGRALDSELKLEEPGVWERHFQIEFEPGNGFFATPDSQALITVNGEPVQRTRLRNGDRIELGGTQLQFWLGETRQRGFRIREWFFWGGILIVAVAQIYLICQFLR